MMCEQDGSNSFFHKVGLLDIQCPDLKNCIIFFFHHMCLLTISAFSWRSHKYLMPFFDKMPQKICVDPAAIDIIDFIIVRNRIFILLTPHNPFNVISI